MVYCLSYKSCSQDRNECKLNGVERCQFGLFCLVLIVKGVGDGRVIIIMSHHSTPRSGFSAKQEVISNLDENNDSLLDESNSFDLKNQIYELTSKYNNLEYEKNKILISYQNVLKEHKQKYAILERLCSEKQEREEKLNLIISEIRSKNAYLTEENEALKKELHSLFEKNRITPDFNTIEMAQEMNMLGDLLEKEERVQKLDRQLQEAKESEFVELREKVGALEKENRRLKDEKLDLQAEKADHIKEVTRDVEEYHKGIIKFKDTTIRKLEEQQMALSLQLDQARQAALQRNSQKSDEYAQHRRKEEKIAQLQQKVALAQKERMRLQTENSGLLQDNRRLQNQKKLLQKSKKSLQEEIIHLSNQISEVRAASFNDKIECKKQVNSIKVEMEEQKHRIRSLIEQKAQENKRLRQSVLTLNDQNQQLRDKQATMAKQLDRMQEENSQLARDNQRYLRQGNKWEEFGKQSSSPAHRQHEEKIATLEHQLNSYKGKLRQDSQRINQLQEELQKYISEINIKQELMKIQKMDYDSKTKQATRKLKQYEQGKIEKQKVIQSLQGQIRNLKDEIRQLELANEELQQKLETMKNINSDVQNIKHQLQLEKQYYEQMRREEEELRRKHKRSEQFKVQQNSREFRSLQMPGQSQHSLKANSIEQSRMKQAQISKEMEQLRAQNYDLQVKINEYENEINKKGIDINMKQDQNRKLKEMLSSPRETNYQPIIETSKKTQFNAVFLQNKILLLQKEIMGLKTLKEKEYEQYKKVYRKKMEEKYHAQVSRSNLYISQLEKNIDLLNNKLQREQSATADLKAKLEQFTKLNYDIKFDYSQTLQELNTLLQQYKQLEKKHKQLQFDRMQMRKVLDQNNRLRAYVEKMNKTTSQKSLRLTNANEQIQKLNQTLMIKQSQIKMLKLASPNSSFIGSNRSEQKSGLLNIPIKQEMQMHASSDTDSLHSWIKKSPNYSRV